MPGINVTRLIEYLNDIQVKLFEIWVEERNFDLADSISSIRDRLLLLINTLKVLET